MANNSPMGTVATGYVKARLGPFKCGNCLHYETGYCNHPKVDADPEVKKEKGRAEVAAGDCCNFFRSES